MWIYVKNIIQILYQNIFGILVLKIYRKGHFDSKVIENGCINKMKIKNRRRKFKFQ